MTKYYKLKLNNARAEYNGPNGDEFGFIEILPVERQVTEKFLFFEKTITKTDYCNPFYVIAEQKDNYFEDIILGKKIKYNPDGLKDILRATNDELSENLQFGMTCFEYQEIDSEEVHQFLEMIKNDENILKKYELEIKNVERRDFIISEFVKRVIDKNQEQPKAKKVRMLKV